MQTRWIGSALFLGHAVTVAGYVPVIAYAEPSLTNLRSRTNTFAALGAALVAGGVASAASVVMGRIIRGATTVTLVAGVALMLAVAITTQVWAQHDVNAAWNEQKDIWQQLFQLCPGIENDTSVYFILPGYEDRWGWANWRRTPLNATWEVSSALRVLYADQSLAGDLIFPNIDRGFGSPRFAADGVWSYWVPTVTPYAETLVLAYDGEPRRLHIVTSLATALRLEAEPVDYHPQARCSARPAPENDLRRLVALSARSDTNGTE